MCPALVIQFPFKVTTGLMWNYSYEICYDTHGSCVTSYDKLKFTLYDIASRFYKNSDGGALSISNCQYVNHINHIITFAQVLRKC